MPGSPEAFMAASRYETWTLPVMRVASGSGIVMSMGAVDRSTMFRRAVLDLSEEPTPVNVRRYLVASRLLARDDARSRTRQDRAVNPLKKESQR
jgi:hypothetical protein